MCIDEKNMINCDCDCEDDVCNCNKITLELEDGSMEDFYILDTLEHDGKNYIALAPEEGDEYYVFGYREDDTHTEFFSLEEDELETISKLFDKRFFEEEEENI